MRYFRKKPIIIEAVQMQRLFTVKTLEGVMEGKAGDYRIIGVHGEHYICDKDIFEATYEEVSEEEWLEQVHKNLATSTH